MRPKSRLFKILLIGLAVGGFVGYFAFSTLLFSPLEKPFSERIAALVSRDVDLYVSKADMAGLFDSFPRLELMDELERTPAWETFEESVEYADIMSDLQLESALAELDRSLAQVPVITVEPLSIFGGKELVLAARVGDGAGTPIDWALYGRVNWMGKFAVAALSYPGLLRLESQGITAEQGDDWVKLSGGNLAQPIVVARVNDVVIVSSSNQFIDEAFDLAARGGERSMLQSARYFDHIHNATLRGPDEKELEFFVDARRLMLNQGMPGPWPDTRSPMFGPSLAGRLFQVPACKELVGILDLSEGVALDLHGELASEDVTSEQARLYRERGFERADVLRDVASFVPDDAALLVYLKGPIDLLLKMVFDSVEPALRSNVEDAFRSTGRYAGLDELIAEIGGSVRNRLMLIVRERDYKYRSDEQVPPNDGQPTYAIALVTWVEDEERIKTLSDAIGQNGDIFGLKGAVAGEGGYYRHKSEGFLTYEFWSEFVPGTGIITTMPANEHHIVSNEIKMLPHLLRTYAQSDSTYRRLADRPQFQALLNASLPDANALVWINPRAGGPTARKLVRSWAEGNVALSVDWRTRRAEEERKVLAERFSGRGRDQLDSNEQQELDAMVDPILQAEAGQLRAQQVPTLMARKTREIEYLEAIDAGLLMVRLDPRSFDLSLRVLIPLGADATP